MVNLVYVSVHPTPLGVVVKIYSGISTTKSLPAVERLKKKALFKHQTFLSEKRAKKAALGLLQSV